MKGPDGILALLQDIKNMLLGIFLLILGCFLFLFGLIGYGAAQALIFVGLPVAVVGCVRTIKAFNHHEVITTPDPPKNEENPDVF